MSDSTKDRIIANLQQAKQTGELKSEKIREIIKTAVTETVTEIQAGRSEITGLFQDAIAAIKETFQEKGGELKEEITASLEGLIAAISSAKREAIAKTQSQIQNLQTQIETEEQKLQQEIDGVLTEIKTQGQTESDKLKTAIESAVETVRDSEEVALLQKRYAQLKAQLAILQANLASRYGEQYEEVKQYLDEAKNWYERAQEEPEVFTDKVAQKRTEFEQKLGEAGSAVAQKEQQVKKLLQELWYSLAEIFHERQK
jgi:chromosome segregation ATPase